MASVTIDENMIRSVMTDDYSGQLDMDKVLTINDAMHLIIIILMFPNLFRCDIIKYQTLDCEFSTAMSGVNMIIFINGSMVQKFYPISNC